jgi:hypothetical protein
MSCGRRSYGTYSRIWPVLRPRADAMRGNVPVPRRRGPQQRQRRARTLRRGRRPARARTLLDDGLTRLTELWSGEFEPRPVQTPRIPIWVAGRWPHRRPVSRAAPWDGMFPIELPGPEALAELAGEIAGCHLDPHRLRTTAAGRAGALGRRTGSAMSARDSGTERLGHGEGPAPRSLAARACFSDPPSTTSGDAGRTIRDGLVGDDQDALCSHLSSHLGGR